MNDKNEKKFKLATLGCRTNQYETQAYFDQLEALGFSPAKEGEVAEICIVNTCTVTESADRQSKHEIRRLTEENPGAKVVVTGCYAERSPESVKGMNGVTHVIPNKEKETLVSTLFPDLEVPEYAIQYFEGHTRAFVKVQDGCNSFCTYCIIPYVRGRSRSRTLDEILKEVSGLINNGYKEVVLTGINIGDFDGARPEGHAPDRLADLVRAVDKVPGLKRLRISSIDPDEVDDDLMAAVMEGQNTCPSLHIVLQSGSNVTLKRMNRKYTRQIFMQTIERLLKKNPDFTFTTDIIVGFPGETDADFNETLEVMREVKFAKVHMFPYSDRPRTRAATYPNKIHPTVIKERKRAVLELSEKIAFELRNKYISRKMEVLIEGEEESARGHTANFLQVKLPGIRLPKNTIVEVELIANEADGLVGRQILSPS